MTREIPEFFQNCSGIFLIFVRKCSGFVPEMFWIVSGNVLEHFRNFSGTFPYICRNFSGFVPELFWTFSGTCSAIFLTPHMEIVVVLIVVKFGFFLVITRDHGCFGGRRQVEILPTSLPELFKSARDLLEPWKLQILGPKFSS